MVYINRISPILLTALSVSLMAFIMGAITILSGTEAPMLMFLAAITLSAWYGGARQGLLAWVLSLVWLIGITDAIVGIPTAGENRSLTELGIFTLNSFLVVAICSLLRNAHTRAKAAAHRLEELQRASEMTEMRLKRIFDSNMIGLAFCDVSGRILDANQYFLNLFGETREDLESGKLNWQTYTTASSESLNEKADHFLPLEKEYLRRDGTRVSALVGSGKADDGCYVTYMIDLTDRKKVELALADAKAELEEKVALRTKQLTDANLELSRSVAVAQMTADRLKESRAFLNSVIENIPNMIFVKDAKELRYVRFNKAGERLLGRTRLEMIGKNDFEVFPKDLAEYYVSKDRTVLESGKPLEIFDEDTPTPEGEKSIRTRKIPVFDASGKPQYLLGISEDITDLRKAQRAEIELRTAQAECFEAEKSMVRLRFLTEASDALSESLALESMLNAFTYVVRQNMAELCFVDLYNGENGTIERANSLSLSEKMPNLVPISDEDSIGRVIRSGQSECLKDAAPETLLKILQDEQLSIVSPRSVIIVPLSYQGQTFGALTFISRADQKFSGIDLSMAQELARRASLAIENARLFRQAEEANRAKSAFLANISHELRTPLGAMLGFAELAMESGSLTREQTNYLNVIAKNGRQLLQIVDEVLDLSKAESDLIDIERTQFSLKRLISDVRSLLQIKADEKGLVFEVTCSTTVPDIVFSDSLRLRQILLNIVGNAIKFTSQGYVKVAIDYKASQVSEQGELFFSIIDTGIGLNADHSRKIFEPFVQADSSTKRRFGGTGLGLFLSRKLARLLGGDLTLARSQLGSGSEFQLRMPVTLPKNLYSEAKESAAKNTSDLHFKTGTKVLVVDDSEDNRTLLESMLKRVGLTVDLASNGSQAMSKALSENYDLVIMDIQMPEMDGFEALKQLRERGYRPPIVALTAHAMKGDRERGIQRGFDDYIYKPFDSAALKTCISRFIERHEAIS